MRRHAGAVILLGGWLLVTAPFDDGHGYWDDTASISRWRPVTAFDTAAACEARLRRCDDKLSLPDCPPGPMRCVPAESVYAPQAPAQK